MSNPVEVRKSGSDDLIFLFYLQSEKYWLTAVAKKEEDYGFLVIAYLTDKIKEGEKIWPR
ncbi:MAG: hypothetical protein KDK36_07420 [Leptospiraceae bacterium]|nr:hypothetical protein [Leptospiraceae bacterium]